MSISEIEKNGELVDDFVQKFKEVLEDNLNLSAAFAIVSELLKSKEKPEDIVKTVLDFDRVFGLQIKEQLEIKQPDVEIPNEVQKLMDERKRAREEKDYKKSDDLRDKIAELGYVVKDGVGGQEILNSKF
jgi:cysteinyl-tRNA synthetase